MKATEAKEALLAAVSDIAKEAEGASLKTNVKCVFGDVDYVEYEDYREEAGILFAELTVTHEGVEDSIIYECAVGLDADEVADADLANEISKMRTAVRELVAALGNAEDRAEAFASEIKAIDPPAEEIDAPKHDNTRFYITAGVAAAVLVLLFILFGKLF